MQNLRLFCDVASLRSFSQAAQRHGITQSAASQRVGQLEKRLGVMLFNRAVRPLELTPAGEEFLRGCRELVARYDQLEHRVARLKPEPSGTLKVDAIYSAGIDLLIQVQESFAQAYPKMHVVVEYKRPEQVVEAVRQKQCDLGIVSYPKRWKDVVSIPLRNERMAVVTAPGHPWAGRSHVQAHELGAWPMIAFEPELPASTSIKRYLKTHGVEMRVAAAFDNVDTMKSAVALTPDHVTILPKRTVMREVRNGTLAVIDLEPELVRPLGIILSKDARPTRWSGTRRSKTADPAAIAGTDFPPGPESIPRAIAEPLPEIGTVSGAEAFIEHLLRHAGPTADLVTRAGEPAQLVEAR